MYYLDSQRTITRRESSLITNKKYRPDEVDTWSINQGPASIPCSESVVSLSMPRKVPVQIELVTMMFESMLNTIVASWEQIAPLPKAEDSIGNMNKDVDKATSATLSGKKKKPTAEPSKPSKLEKSRRSRSKLAVEENAQEPLGVSWWSSPDEKVIIHFRNGNLYEGHISMKCMHGEGRFQWADGTVYLGHFVDNEINGKGLIQWKDDTWYQGDFVGNLRHGKGLYVDSRLQRSYTGGWHCGAKHGDGVIYYSNSFKNSYDGQWDLNERFGYGSREYGPSSGYKGEWERNVREGKGHMIWPNGDFYKGSWKAGVMSGYGVYIWDTHFNNTMSLPSLKLYRGDWENGERTGFGLLNLGSGLGSFYKGEFQNNKKHGAGRLVTNSGLVIQDRHLFMSDNVAPSKSAEHKLPYEHTNGAIEPLQFDICDGNIELSYHIEQALKNIDKEEESISDIISDYIENNNKIYKFSETNPSGPAILAHKEDQIKKDCSGEYFMDELIMFEDASLRKALKCYETDLKNIYYKYATICNTDEINFNPILIRLYLWQLYYDCNIHEKGLTLYDIDILYYQNRQWLAQTPHNPFEKIYFWQFLNSLISVASKLYAKKKLPDIRPDTILASAFRTFMEQDVLSSFSVQKGLLVYGYGSFIPLKATYELYQSLGEPHSVRDFLRAVRRSAHFMNRQNPSIVDAPDQCLPVGRNVFVIGNEMSFIVDKKLPEPQEEINKYKLKLFNFANLSSKTIIDIFAKIFPQLIQREKIMELNIKLTFLEFFEAFVKCAEESIIVRDEEVKWREKILNMSTVAPHSTSTGYLVKTDPTNLSADFAYVLN